MRHVSRTYRVALDWLFDRVNLEPQIQIKCVDTKNQLAEMLTKGSFSRDEWDHFLCVFDIMNFSMYSWSHFIDFLSNDQVREQSAMSKRGQKTNSNEGSPIVDESRHSSWAKLFGNFESEQEHEIEEIQSLFNITQKLIWEHSEEILTVITILKVHLYHGRDRCCLMMKWSSGQRQKYVSTQIPYCVWEDVT